MVSPRFRLHIRSDFIIDIITIMVIIMIIITIIPIFLFLFNHVFVIPTHHHQLQIFPLRPTKALRPRIHRRWTRHLRVRRRWFECYVRCGVLDRSTPKGRLMLWKDMVGMFQWFLFGDECQCVVWKQRLEMMIFDFWSLLTRYLEVSGRLWGYCINVEDWILCDYELEASWGKLCSLIESSSGLISN